MLKFAGLGIGLLGEANGDLFPMVDQCRRAVAWVYRNAATFGGNPDELYLCSRSSGSHLASFLKFPSQGYFDRFVCCNLHANGSGNPIFKVLV